MMKTDFNGPMNKSSWRYDWIQLKLSLILEPIMRVKCSVLEISVFTKWPCDVKSVWLSSKSLSLSEALLSWSPSRSDIMLWLLVRSCLFLPYVELHLFPQAWAQSSGLGSFFKINITNYSASVQGYKAQIIHSASSWMKVSDMCENMGKISHCHV